jgi:hypothetical protein
MLPHGMTISATQHRVENLPLDSSGWKDVTLKTISTWHFAAESEPNKSE